VACICLDGDIYLELFDFEGKRRLSSIEAEGAN